ncbi:uncharacterized protein LOC126995340 [Eriocheir sinensis]|uniref:uncharacterized protein LOC126995340 n=1 Tax=Eriocheir sinensis TaxID=95602 RepID=UPI0021C95575|nr:uncharacterized protein LOC126995340 [Eriocheir sinensis]
MPPTAVGAASLSCCYCCVIFLCVTGQRPGVELSLELLSTVQGWELLFAFPTSGSGVRLLVSAPHEPRTHWAGPSDLCSPGLEFRFAVALSDVTTAGLSLATKENLPADSDQEPRKKVKIKLKAHDLAEKRTV